MKNLIKVLFAVATFMLTGSLFLLNRTRRRTNKQDDDKKNKDHIGDPAKGVDSNLEQTESDTKQDMMIDLGTETRTNFSKYESTHETTNHVRITRMILGPCTDLLRDVLRNEKQPHALSQSVKTIHVNLPKGKMSLFTKEQETLIYNESYSDFDITLLYILFRNVCNIQPHTNKWGFDPNISDKSLSANIERIRLLRNKYLGHTPNIKISDCEFEQLCKYIKNIVKEIESCLGTSTNYQDAVEEIKTVTMDPEQKEEFHGKIMNLKNKLDIISESRIAWIESITSAELWTLFNSFSIENPDESTCNNFVCKILKESTLQKLVHAINSLSKGVVLTKNTDTTEGELTVSVRVSVVDIIRNEARCHVAKKESVREDFLKDDCLVKIILIRSKSFPVVEAKLTVYKTYSQEINDKNIYLQHELEEIDEVAKICAYQKLSEICIFVESVIDTFETYLYESYEKPLTPDRIIQIFTQTKDITVENGREWGQYVADEISKLMLKNKDSACSQAWNTTKIKCQKTIENLRALLCKMKKFQDKVIPVDQNKLIKEWQKRDISHCDHMLRNYPSVLKYIVGHRGDGKAVVKVYLHSHATEAILPVLKLLPKETTLEFVNVQDHFRKKSKQREKEAPPIDRSTRLTLKKIISERGEQIYARYSNVIGIGISAVRREGDGIHETPCIVFYCLDKTLIPFGEKPLPKFLAGWPCDIREDFARLGVFHTRNCGNLPKPGCSIGLPDSVSRGSVGFLVQSKDSKMSIESGFLTASHVAVANYEDLYFSTKPLSLHQLRLKQHVVVHPSWVDNNENKPVGEVVESYFGNYEFLKSGVDVAVVKSNTSIQKDLPEG